MTVLCGTCLLAAAGCGNHGRAGVHGRVTLDGDPLVGAGVVFKPESGGRESRGVTDASGDYILQYIRNDLGGTIGKNTVRITKQLSHDPASEILPEKYNKKTTLTADVKSGDQEIDFPLTSK